jgi:hypothetical protein
MPRESRFARNEAVFREVNERNAELVNRGIDPLHIVARHDDYEIVDKHPEPAVDPELELADA